MITTMHCHAGEEEAKMVERGGGERNGLNRSWHLEPNLRNPVPGNIIINNKKHFMRQIPLTTGEFQTSVVFC